MVPQDPHLFHDTVIAKLRYARPDATDEGVADTCRAARIHDLIERLRTATRRWSASAATASRAVRSSGLRSPGALLKDPAILILDEATSHLDSENKALVQEALAELLRGRTSFVIAHRLSTIRQAHQILVIDSGRVVDRGRHKELLETVGLYAQLHATQFRAA